MQLRAGALDGIVDHAAIQLDLALARPASGADTALLALQVAPTPHQACAEVLQPRQFYLQFALVAACPLGKNLQNQHGAVIDRSVEKPFQIALLRRAESLVKQNLGGAVRLRQFFDFFRLAFADEQGRIRRLAFAGNTRHGLHACRLRQQPKLFQFAVKMRQTQINADQNGARFGKSV